MATRERRYGPGGGITLGGIVVIVGIVLMLVWSFWIGLIIAVIGLVAFGGFARGRWYWSDERGATEGAPHLVTVTPTYGPA